MTRLLSRRVLAGGTIAGLLSLLWSGLAAAQSDEPGSVAPVAPALATSGATMPAIAPTSVAPTEEQKTPSPTEGATSNDSASRIAAIEKQLDAQSLRMNELEATNKGLSTQLATSDSEGSEERRLAAWGFFDVTFGRCFYDDARALYAEGTPRKWSFMSNGINVYLKSEMTKQLSAMVETRLTYTPIGYVSDKPANIYVNGAYLQTQGSFARQDAVVRLPYSYAAYQQNGVVIERAHFDWKPRDWFGIRLGRFLTPYGIWNEDHGSPVVLGVDMPNLINYELVPTHQTGLVIYGSHLLTENLNLEYALTVSNGRGPIDQYEDLDNNKAIGLRAKLVYNSDDLLLRLGGYLYYGRYTDRNEQTNVYLTSAMTLDRSQPVPFGSQSDVTNSYRETVGTLDAMLQYKGFKLMAELAQRKVLYDHAPSMMPESALLNNVPYSLTAYAASYTGIAYYALMGYEFNLGEHLWNTKVTPYVGADHLSPDETTPELDMNQFRFGVNVKPSPYVTNKIEAMRVIPKADEMASRLWMVLFQTAVSF